MYAPLPVKRRGFTGVSRRLDVDPLCKEQFWGNPRTASRYMRLRKVFGLGTDGDVGVQSISEDQYREFNESPLSKLI